LNSYRNAQISEEKKQQKKNKNKNKNKKKKNLGRIAIPIKVRIDVHLMLNVAGRPHGMRLRHFAARRPQKTLFGFFLKTSFFAFNQVFAQDLVRFAGYAHSTKRFSYTSTQTPSSSAKILTKMQKKNTHYNSVALS
jgi:hypothetical protein